MAVVVPGGRHSQEWVDVQSGVQMVLPSQRVVILSPPLWNVNEQTFFSDFGKLNPLALPLGEGRATQEPFLALLTGGGVEGLSDLLVIEQRGDLEHWRRRGHLSNAALRLERTERLQEDKVALLFELASKAELAKRRVNAWHCGVLDGLTVSLVMFDGETVGRAHYANLRYPRGALGELADALVNLLQSENSPVEAPRPGN